MSGIDFNHDPMKPLTPAEAGAKLFPHLKKEADKDMHLKISYAAGCAFALLVGLALAGGGATFIALNRGNAEWLHGGIGLCIISVVPFFFSGSPLMNALAVDIQHQHEGRLQKLIANPLTDPNIAYLAYRTYKGICTGGIYNFIMDVLGGRKKLDAQFMQTFEFTQTMASLHHVDEIVRTLLKNPLLKEANPAAYKTILEQLAPKVRSVVFEEAKAELHRFTNLETLEMDLSKTPLTDLAAIKNDTLAFLRIKACKDPLQVIEILKLFPNVENFTIETPYLDEKQARILCQAMQEHNRNNSFTIKVRNLDNSIKLLMQILLTKYYFVDDHFLYSDPNFDRVTFKRKN